MTDVDDLTPEQVLTYARERATKIPSNWGKDWMTESARDLLRIAVALGGFDFKELAMRLTRIKPRGEKINARTVERVLSQMKREAETARHHATRKITTAAEALLTSEWAKRLTDDAFSADDHRAAAKAHLHAVKIHKASADEAGAAWLHDLAASNHRQAAKWRATEARVDTVKAVRTKKTFEAYQEKITAARDHESMAQEYARQALAAARKRVA